MRALKVLVVVMGVMIIAGVGVLAAVIAGRLSSAPPPPQHPVREYTAPLEIPHGARIGGMATSADRLVLRLVLPEGHEQYVIVDLATGARLGTIDLAPAP
jgi:hypothetical protein